MIVVSNRGPFRFVGDDRRHLRAPAAGRAASPARCTPLATSTTRRRSHVGRGRDRATTTAPRSTAPARPTLPDSTSVFSTSTRTSTGCTTTSFERDAVVPAPRAVRPAPPPPFDQRFREAWDAYVAVNQALRRRVIAARRPTATSCSCRTTSSRSCPGCSRAAAPRPARRALHPHAVLRAELDPRAARRRRRRDLRVDGRASRAASTPPGGRGVRGVGARGARRRPIGRRRSRRRSVPTPTPSPTSAASPRPRRGRLAALDDARRRPQLILRSDRIDPSKNIVRGLPRVRPPASSTTRMARAGRVRRDARPVARERSPEYLAYRQEVEQAAAAVNERWATATGSRSWSTRATTSRAPSPGFAALRRAAREPVKDGLNLVAKEGPLVNGRDGVLCLSPEAGAFDELGHAVLALRTRSTSSRPPARCTPRSTMPPTSAASARRPAPRASRRRARPRPGSRPHRRTALISCACRPPRRALRGAAPGRRGRRPRRRRRGSRAAPPPTARRCARRAPAARDVSSRSSAANAGRSPVSSPANAAACIPSHELLDGRALVDRHRRAQLHGHPPADGAIEPVRPRPAAHDRAIASPRVAARSASAR